jgi:hypothetical protein
MEKVLSWSRRNWKRIVALVFVVIAINLVAFNNSEAKKLALASATSHPELIALLGQPIRSSWWITGGIETSAGIWNAELAIPISGPKAKGTLHVQAEKTAGVWRLVLLQFEAADDGPWRDLLRDSAAAER